MTYLHSSLFFLHILFGTCALILFWVPMTTKKGQLNHRRFGVAYKYVMYAVAGTGALMAVIVMAIPLVIKSQFAGAENAENIASNIRYFWAFLLFLAVLSFTTTRHGHSVLKAKDNRQSLRTFSYVLPIVLLGIGGVSFIVMGTLREASLHLVFGILGLAVSMSMLRYIFKATVSPRTYYLEHIGAMIGSGIGAYTAFFAFGGRQIFSGAGSYQLIFWIAPGVLGSILSYYLTTKYAKVFKVEKKASGNNEVSVG